jgi:hypothetical protein
MNQSKYKYCSLNIGGERLDYCYNPVNGEVSTQLFPGIPIHRVTLGCGMYATHDDIRTIIEHKLEIPCKRIEEDLF